MAFSIDEAVHASEGDVNACENSPKSLGGLSVVNGPQAQRKLDEQHDEAVDGQGESGSPRARDGIAKDDADAQG